MGNLNSIILNPMEKYNGTEEEFQTIMENEIIETKKKLREIKTEKNKKTLEEQKKEAEKKFKRSQSLYESYDPAKFETKTRIDLLFYEHIAQSLPEIDNLEMAVAEYYKIVEKIYETVNLKPENHKMLNTSVLVESYNDQVKRFKKILSEHVNNNYYQFPPEKRKEKFLVESKDYASKFVEKGLDIDKSISIGIKSCLMESLLKNIALPKSVQKRVKYLCEDEDYGKVFDQGYLKELYENFNTKTKQIASIMAFAI